MTEERIEQLIADRVRKEVARQIQPMVSALEATILAVVELRDRQDRTSTFPRD
jgi:hypothetical protein